jgi:hypothetical protein
MNGVALTADAQRAEVINQKHREVVALGRTAKEIAAEIGEELIAVKTELKHGEFTPWVEQNCSFTDRHARRYMKVAEAKRTRMSDFKIADSIAEVLALGKPKPAPKPDTRAATLNDLRKVERLRALRDDPSATEGEKQAAQHKLDDIEKEIGPVEPDTRDAKRNVESNELVTEAAKVVLAEMFETKRARDLITHAILNTYGNDPAKLNKLVNILKAARKV